MWKILTYSPTSCQKKKMSDYCGNNISNSNYLTSSYAQLVSSIAIEIKPKGCCVDEQVKKYRKNGILPKAKHMNNRERYSNFLLLRS